MTTIPTSICHADACADTIGWHLQHHHDTVLSRATINRILVRHGTVTPELVEAA